ncbi:MAG: 50S ribosomal protein L18 [Terriglobia bacterium]
MSRPTTRRITRQRIHTRIRKRLQGTGERPRLNIFRSLKHIYAQIIDDTRGHTLAAAGSGAADSALRGANVAAARAVGKRIGEQALAQGIRQVAFDRGGYRYHGRVKALADAAREAGLQF